MIIFDDSGSYDDSVRRDDDKLIPTDYCQTCKVMACEACDLGKILLKKK